MNIAFLIAATVLLATEAYALRIPNHKYLERIKNYLRGSRGKSSPIGSLRLLCFTLLLFSPYTSWVLAGFSVTLFSIVYFVRYENERTVSLWLERVCSLGFAAVVFTHLLIDVL